MPTIAPISEESFAKIHLDTLERTHPKTADSQLEILAGPILRYWGMDSAVWRGSVTYVTRDSGSSYEKFPKLTLRGQNLDTAAVKFAAVDGISFWRFDFDINMHESKSIEVPYRLGAEHEQYAFWIPGVSETMRTMFYSCNGFSLAVDPKEFPNSMWDNVLSKHQECPIHVMLGGGDQLYCDSINLVLPENTLANRGEVPEEARMRELINQFYLHQYVDWYGRGYWKGRSGETFQKGWVKAIATIPSLNIYDDHDIIDGYGTYRDSTMKSPIFEILGEYAYRYYMYFQQNVAVGSHECSEEVQDPKAQDPKLQDPSWVTTGKPGPYIQKPARSIYARLGKSACFFGLDCRTERKIDQVCTPDSYRKMFSRLQNEIQAHPELKHVYLMLGVPIAYPRMVFVENLMSSKLIGPVKWLSKHKIAFKGLVNPFDGDVELLDDLNDHWCAKKHKAERNWFVKELVNLQRTHGVRVTILSGDVHLCAVGVFRARKGDPKPENDYEFMVCPVSSAIVNTPPPQGLSNFLDRRNKNHYLDKNITERMIPIFNVDANSSQVSNHTTMAKRNYCLLDPVLSDDPVIGQQKTAGAAFKSGNQPSKLKHELTTTVVPESIRMTLNVEVSPKSSTLETVPYELYIPSYNKN